MRGRCSHKSQAPRWGSLLSLRLTGCSGPFCHSCAPRRDAHQVVIRGRSQCFAMIDPCQTQNRPPTALSSGGPGPTAQGVELQCPFRPVSTDSPGGYAATVGAGAPGNRWVRQRPRNLIASLLATATIARLRPIRGARWAKRSLSALSQPWRTALHAHCSSIARRKPGPHFSVCPR